MMNEGDASHVISLLDEVDPPVNYKGLATLIAVGLQSAYRGWSERQRLQVKLWYRYHVSAYTIQRVWREYIEWREIIVYTNIRRLQRASDLQMANANEIKAAKKAMKYSRLIPPKNGSPSRRGRRGKGKGKKNGKTIDMNNGASSSDEDDVIVAEPETRLKARPVTPEKAAFSIVSSFNDFKVPQSVMRPTSLNFKQCLRNKASFDEKMSVWRAVIELRRGHSKDSVDICLKAMLEAEGDISRAMILMGDPTYHLKNEGKVPLYLRLLFMPFLKQDQYLPKNSPVKRKQKQLKDSLIAGQTGTGVSGIRNLKTLKGGDTTDESAAHLENDDDEEGLDLSQLISYSYFSKYYSGNPTGLIAPCMKPKPVKNIPSTKPIKPSERVQYAQQYADIFGDMSYLPKRKTKKKKTTKSALDLKLDSMGTSELQAMLNDALLGDSDIVDPGSAADYNKAGREIIASSPNKRGNNVNFPGSPVTESKTSDDPLVKSRKEEDIKLASDLMALNQTLSTFQ